MKITEKIDKYLNEENINENVISDVADIIKTTGKPLVDLRTPLEKIFKKKDIDFVFSPVPHFRIKTQGKTLILVNKKYADKAEETIGEIAIGYEGKI